MRRVLPWLLVGLVAACGSSAPAKKAAPTTTTSTSTSTSTTISTTSTTASSTTSTTLADSDTTGKSELADGRWFGYWRSFEIGDTIAFGEFDPAEFLTGKAAQQAAAARGQTVENDYFIVNDDKTTHTLIAHGDTVVQVLASGGGSPEHVASNVADFAVDRRKDAGFWVTITKGIVTKIEEQFVP